MAAVAIYVIIPTVNQMDEEALINKITSTVRQKIHYSSKLNQCADCETPKVTTPSLACSCVCGQLSTMDLVELADSIIFSMLSLQTVLARAFRYLSPA